MATYMTRDGDMLDVICLQYYGRANGAVEVVLDRNPALAALGPVYVVGVQIELPDLPPNIKNTIETHKTIRLWD